jgi:meiotic recombination protein DMC1
MWLRGIRKDADNMESQYGTMASERSMMTEPDEVVPDRRRLVATGEAADEEAAFQSVDDLQAHGIGVTDIQKLKLAGICTIKGVSMTSKRALMNVKGLSEAKAEKIKEASAKLHDSGFISALEFSMKRSSVFKVSTGCEEFDRLLGGGIESMSITEVFGEFRTGKTQISMTLCITCQMGIEGAAGKAAYIDTEGTL